MSKHVIHQDITRASTNIIVGVVVLTFLSFVITFFGSARERYLSGDYVVILFFSIPLVFMLMGALTLVDFFAEDFHLHHMHYKIAGTLVILYGVTFLALNQFKPSIGMAWTFMTGFALVLHGIKRSLHG